MESYAFFKDLAIIILAAKLLGIIARKLHAPQVVGEIVAGLLIGPGILGLVSPSDFLTQMAEIGVILLMFMAGLETDLKELVKTGPIALLIACVGVIVPLLGGYVLYSAYYGFSPFGSDEFYRAVFIGVIMTATSVSITVQTLREMGRLRSRTGTIILSAAIIDDIIGIIVLTFVIGFRNPDSNPIDTVKNTGLFFIFAAVVGYIIYKLFKIIDKKYTHRRRIPILGLALCMIFAYCAEKYFSIADITGAYVAGIILCSLRDSEYIAEKMDINSYMLFGPVFFASIGLKIEFSGVTLSLLVFSAFFVLVALSTKIIGCGLAALATKQGFKNSLRIGVGMMTRGEVALIVAKKGLSAGILDAKYFTAVILLILVSSISTPIILKLLYRGEPLSSVPEEETVKA